MVGWYDPPQLARTAARILTSTILGERIDQRLLEALASKSEAAEVYDYTLDDTGAARDEIWLDYVSDLGDGWNPTYAVACTLAQPTLGFTTSYGDVRTERGRILVFGGDEVYPTPSRAEYNDRLVHPYAMALRYSDVPHPDVFAIPGNHDWYDSLVSFSRLFCSRRSFGGWRTRQSRSYFALKLPRGWWLLGTDVQLGSDIDAPQVEYFKQVAAQMADTDHVILCNAEPHWVYASIYGKYDPNIDERNLAFLERDVLGKKVTVFLAGDLHHYRRHAAPDGTQRITAGGGGAFLHPTHGPNVQTLYDGSALRACYPPVSVSRALSWRNIGFLIDNWKFGVVTGVGYALTSCSVNVDLVSTPHTLGQALGDTLRVALVRPTAGFWFVTLFLGIWMFTETHAKWYRFVMGSVHGLAHVAAAFLVGWGASSLAAMVWKFGSIGHSVAATLIMVAGGWVVGSTILGLYLLVSLNVFGRHSTEAFSSLRIEDWKCFLRLHVDRDGALHIFPVGLQRVPRAWKPRRGGTGPELEPADAPLTPELIEPPIVVAPAAARLD
jgi:hypothetical protein